MAPARFTAFGALCLALSVAGLAPARAAQGTLLHRLLQRGDEAYAAKQLWQAVGFYREALGHDERNYEALWRLGRAFVGLAAVAPDKARKSAAGKKAYAFGLRAIASRPGGVEGHYWAALGIGDHGGTLGYLAAWREGIRDKFLKHLDAARGADPRYQDGGPDRIYGIYYHRLPWPMKDVGKALRHLRRAQGYDRDNILTLYYLGAVAVAADQPAAAKEALRRCAAQDPRRGDRLYTERYHPRCKRLLAKLGE